MAPPGPPPYTQEQITAMTSPEEQIRACAELKSYIARLKKEKEQRETYQANGYSGYAQPGGRDNRGNHTSYRFGPRRGGHGPYHPYQRPHVAQKFPHNSVTFNKAEPTADASDTTNHTQRPVNTTVSTWSGPRQTEPKTLCPALTSTGVCSRHGCRHLHDPNKQALCKRWLYKNDCPRRDHCPLSHEASPHNAPTCLHFQEGRCNNDDCRFAHVRVNPAAPNCEPFGRLGYCEKGDSCPELHAHECPAFANTGACQYGDKCRLGHVHRASRMRKPTRLSSADHSSRSNTPDASDTPEEDMDTAEDTHEWIRPETRSAQKPHQFTQQADFVPLDSDK
ncbi:hypothetical protein EJ02DRAFT_450715 [Clathrospora elynae]|uniref:C3H1-type domain-containing protein n=1 Tax=Clathrospora elynae TaxID=706981 RepID=A0A6A5T680_9PLEO|nr:hypothetical protein EJ02DRAFT_450715 [Clathrospora elynae]